MVRGLLGLQEVFETSLMEILTEELPDEAPSDLEERIAGIVSDLADSLTEALGPMIQKAAVRGLKAQRKHQRQFESRLSRHWQKPFELLDLFILLAREAGHDFNREFADEAQRSNNYRFAALVSLHARACRIASAILALLRSGFADDAYVLWRVLYEISIVSAFLSEQSQDTAKRYLRYETVQQYRLALKYDKHAARLEQEPMPQEEFDRLKTEYDELIREFGKPFGENYGWAASALDKERPTIAYIEEAICMEHWRPYYAMASDNVHANAHGNFFALGLSESTQGVLLAGPSNTGFADPGHQTAMSLCLVTTVLLTTELFETDLYLDGLIVSKILGTLVEPIGDEFLHAQEELEGLGVMDGQDSHEEDWWPPDPVLARVAPAMKGHFRSLVKAYLKAPC